MAFALALAFNQYKGVIRELPNLTNGLCPSEIGLKRPLAKEDTNKGG